MAADGPSHLGVGDGVGAGVGVASKTIDDPVPITAATTIRIPNWPAAFAKLVQDAEVAEVQLVVEHQALASETEAEGSEIPRCKPEMVSCAPPDSGALTLRDEDTTGAAKEGRCFDDNNGILRRKYGDPHPGVSHRRS
jgi:hypothetical protein